MDQDRRGDPQLSPDIASESQAWGTSVRLSVAWKGFGSLLMVPVKLTSQIPVVVQVRSSAEPSKGTKSRSPFDA
jgi:hypothetical protein